MKEKLYTYRATAYLSHGEDVIKSKVFSGNYHTKEGFMRYIDNELMLNHNPTENWHVSYGPISIKPYVVKKEN